MYMHPNTYPLTMSLGTREAKIIERALRAAADLEDTFNDDEAEQAIRMADNMHNILATKAIPVIVRPRDNSEVS